MARGCAVLGRGRRCQGDGTPWLADARGQWKRRQSDGRPRLADGVDCEIHQAKGAAPRRLGRCNHTSAAQHAHIRRKSQFTSGERWVLAVGYLFNRPMFPREPVVRPRPSIGVFHHATLVPLLTACTFACGDLGDGVGPPLFTESCGTSAPCESPPGACATDEYRNDDGDCARCPDVDACIGQVAWFNP